MKEVMFENEGRRRKNFGWFCMLMGKLLVKLGKKYIFFFSFLDNYLQNKLK